MCGKEVTPVPASAIRNGSSVEVDYPTKSVRSLRPGQMFKRAKSTGDFSVYLSYMNGNSINLETGKKGYGMMEENVYPLPAGSLVKLVQG